MSAPPPASVPLGTLATANGAPVGTFGQARPNGLAAAAPRRDQMVRRLRTRADGVALRVAWPREGAPLALLRTLAEDAAARSGAELIEADALLLVGLDAASAAALADRIDAIGVLPQVERLPLPEASETVLAWADGPPPRTAPLPPAEVAPLDQRLAAVPPERLLAREPIVRLGTAAPRVVAERLVIMERALTAALGGLAADPNLAAHVAETLAAWCLSRPEAARLVGAGPPSVPLPSVPLIVPLPRQGAPAPPDEGHRVALLGLDLAADPAVTAARRRTLAASGWGLAVGPVGAAALRLIDPASIAADLLLLRWSPELAGPAAIAALRTLDPRHLVLCGCDTAAAVAWGQGLGIARFAGSAVPRGVQHETRQGASP